MNNSRDVTHPLISAQSQTSSTRLYWVDSLRIIAIALVVIGHIAQFLEQPWGAVIHNHFFDLSVAKIGVVIFLFVSGLGLHLSQTRRSIAPLQFYLQRLWRIYPMYWTALTVGLILNQLRHEPVFESWNEAILMVSGFCAFAGRWGCNFTMGWFIGLILSLYCLYPLLAWAMRRYAAGTLCVLFVISVSSRLIVESLFTGYPLEWFPLCRVFEFGLGLYWVERGIPGGASSPRWVAFLSDISFPLYLLHYSFAFVFWHASYPWHLLVYLAIVILASIAVSTVEERAKAFLTSLKRVPLPS
ncbi:MAG: acyltransferase [Nitrospiraceae bacterium]